MKELAHNPRYRRDLFATLAGLEKPPVRRAPAVATIRAGDGSRLELAADDTVRINGRQIGTCAPDGVETFLRLAAEQRVIQ